MTIADIKEYINSQLEPLARLKGTHQAINYNACLLEVLDMLEQLDKPKAKWLYSADEDEAPYYRCSNCGNISSNGTEETCENCGAEIIDFWEEIKLCEQCTFLPSSINEWVSVDDRLPTKEDILFNDEPNFAITYKNNWNEIKTTYCYFDFEKKRFRITGVDVLAWKTFGEPYKESE